MQSEIAKFLSLVLTSFSLLISLAVTVAALGVSAAVLVGLGTVAFTVVVTVAGVWLVGTRTRSRYAEQVMAMARETESMVDTSTEALEPELSTEVVPAFQDIGVERTREAILEMIDKLDLPAEKAQKERDFVARVAADKSLARRDKVERIVRHFASKRVADWDPPA